MRQICEEKGLAYESVLAAIEAALAAAYRKDFGDKMQNLEAEFNPETGDVLLFDVKTVVEDVDLEEIERFEEERRAKAEDLAKQIEEAREKGEEMPAVSIDEEEGPKFNPKTDVMISEAKQVKVDVELGEILRTELEKSGEFGRMAAMTAKQVIMQKLREAEREIIFSEYKEHEGQLLIGSVQRREGRVILVDIGRATGVVRGEDQMPGERYSPGDRLKFFVRQVALSTRGPEILLSRTSEELVRQLFFVEIPEIAEGVVEIKGISREPGSRSKVAVYTEDNSIDPIGACIGQRGSRIQTVIAEMGGEKIDIIEWSDEPEVFITNSLSPAKIERVELNEEERSAAVHVVQDQLSLAIGRGGQNVRLAAHLTGWKINISEVTENGEVKEETEDGETETPDATNDVPTDEVPAEESSPLPEGGAEGGGSSETVEESVEAEVEETPQPEADQSETETETPDAINGVPTDDKQTEETEEPKEE